MIGQTSGIEKSVKCTAAIAAAYTIGKFGADDDTLSLAVAATDNLVGIFQHITSNASDEVRVMLTGISRVIYGAAVTRGQNLTSDAAGKAVPAVKGDSIIGQALVSGVANDIGVVQIHKGQVNPNAAVNGNHTVYVARATYDPAVNGGAVGAHGLGVTIPDKALMKRGYGDIKTAFTSTGNNGTIALGANAANDLLAAVDPDTLSGIFELIPVGTAASMVKATAARELTITVATNEILTGKAVFFVEYVMSE